MTVFQYTAKDQVGHEFSGTYEDIDSVAGLREELSKMGYVLLKARRGKKRRKSGRIKESEIVTFAYKFSEMYSAGLPIIGILEMLEEQTTNYALKYIIGDVRQSIETGSNLTKAFGKYRNIFSGFFLGMIEAGETGGKLATVLEMSAAYLEEQADLKRKVRAAFIYPLIVSILCFAVVGFIVAFIVPVFAKLYQQMRVPLPAPTQALVNFSFLVRDWWWAIAIVVVAAVIIIRRFSRKPYVKAKWDAFKLKMPIFGKLNRMVVISHFTKTLSILTSVGVSLTKALEMSSLVADNYKVTEITKELQESVNAGNSVAKSFKNYDIFPTIITQLADSGEEAGVLPKMLGKGAGFLDKDIDRIIKGMLVKLEPALTVMLGILVGLILIAIYLPMFDYMTHLK
jgi:type IV pilus assembly protein PilC